MTGMIDLNGVLCVLSLLFLILALKDLPSARSARRGGVFCLVGLACGVSAVSAAWFGLSATTTVVQTGLLLALFLGVHAAVAHRPAAGRVRSVAR